ncbi:ribonuclease E/G [Emcibacter sp.]|uniref:ribonuclease E/G n=1 Tax=Emcibacter sp. TaxID=1979954 RepID=UPI002AA6AA08|nr:ribonuclease E/G [Emcibacter sp.]
MSRKLLVTSAPGEIRCALLEDNRPVEIRLYRDHEPSYVGAIYLGRIRSVSRELQAAFVELENGPEGFLPLKLLPKPAGGDKTQKKPAKKPKDLTQLVSEGQKIIVQVTRDPVDGKEASLTGRIELHSSGLVLHPFRAGAFVSSRIKDPDRRHALKSFGESLELGGLGLTFRTEAADLPDQQLADMADRLLGQWKAIEKNLAVTIAPKLLAQGPEPLSQIMRTFSSNSLEAVIFDHAADMKKAHEWTGSFAPELTGRLQQAAAGEDIFSQYGVEDDLESLFEKRLPLNSGGWITIEETEALTAVDVNTGGALLSTDREQQILRLNREAAREIFRQLRLRAIGGLIVIDFVNMSGKGEVTALMDVIDNLIQADPQQTQRSNISAFGLLELIRKADVTSLGAKMLTARVPQPNVATRALELLREATLDAEREPGKPCSLKGPAAVLDWIRKHPTYKEEFTRRTGSQLTLEEDKRDQ